MTEAAIVLPVVVLFMLAAHEFMWFNHNLHRTIWATRYLVWEVALATDHPGHDDSGDGEISHGTRDTKLREVKDEAYDLFFKDKPGHHQDYHTYWRPVTKGDNPSNGVGDGGVYGYYDSFPQDLDLTSPGAAGTEPGGSTVGKVIEFMFAGGKLTDLGIPEGLSDLLGGGEFTIGPDLPVKGLYDAGYISGWKPAFFKILLPGEGRGTGKKAFLSSDGQVDQYESMSELRGGERVIWFGWYDGKAPWYGKLSIITHSWQAIDTEYDLWYHTKGFTLLGSLPAGSSEGLQSEIGGKGAGESFVGDMIGEVLPFRCFVYPHKVGQPSEGSQMQSTRG